MSLTSYPKATGTRLRNRWRLFQFDRPGRFFSEYGFSAGLPKRDEEPYDASLVSTTSPPLQRWRVRLSLNGGESSVDVLEVGLYMLYGFGVRARDDFLRQIHSKKLGLTFIASQVSGKSLLNSVQNITDFLFDSSSMALISWIVSRISATVLTHDRTSRSIILSNAYSRWNSSREVTGRLLRDFTAGSREPYEASLASTTSSRWL